MITLLLPLPAMAEKPLRVIDGDTLVVDGHHVRLQGIDAPESKQFCKNDGRVWPCGRTATKRLRQMVEGQKVICDMHGTDRYHRVLAECFTTEGSLNRAMVATGWAFAYSKYSREFEPEQAQAEAAQRGMWDSEVMPPWAWRKSSFRAQ